MMASGATRIAAAAAAAASGIGFVVVSTSTTMFVIAPPGGGGGVSGLLFKHVSMGPPRLPKLLLCSPEQRSTPAAVPGLPPSVAAVKRGGIWTLILVSFVIRCNGWICCCCCCCCVEKAENCFDSEGLATSTVSLRDERDGATEQSVSELPHEVPHDEAMRIISFSALSSSCSSSSLLSTRALTVGREFAAGVFLSGQL
ncbi:hypothetical protein IWX49DRAFT_559220 [Phyllosticta citricarpa]